MQDRTPFTYHVFWTALNKGYIGCRYGKGCHPSSLGTSYFSSNPEVQALWKTQAPDVVEITEYSTPEEAFNAENQLIRSVALNDPRYFNQTCGFGVIIESYARTDEIRAKNSASNKGRAFSNAHCAAISAAKKGKLGISHSEEARTKMSAAQKGRVFSEETRAKMKAAQQNRSSETRAKMSAAQKGKTAAAETRAKISAAQKGKTLSEEHKNRIGLANKGKTVSEETRAKLSASTKRKAELRKAGNIGVPYG